MRIRVRFEKTGPIRYVGHLDFMRTFQKIIKKSGLLAVYTTGFNPHLVLSFADPLGVGQESTGEYADIEFAYRDTAPMTEQELYRLTDIGLDNEALPLPPSSGELVAALNAASPDGVRFTDAVRVGLIKSSKAMANVRYASYVIALSDEALSGVDLTGAVEAFLKRENILVHKVTKKSEKDVDIRPQILSLAVQEAADFPSFIRDPAYGGRRSLRLQCVSGSFENLKPQTMLEALAADCGRQIAASDYRLVRMELYDGEGRPLRDSGIPF